MTKLRSKAGHAYLVIDGTLISIDRVAADRPFYSGKHRKPGMNLQVIASPSGDIVWVSGPLPGAVHDLTAARIWGIVQALAASGLVVLGDKGYLGEACIRTPYRGRNKPASCKDANRVHARLRPPVNAPMPSSSPGTSCVSSAAVPGAPGSWPRPSTSFRLTKAAGRMTVADWNKGPSPSGHLTTSWRREGSRPGRGTSLRHRSQDPD